MAQEYTIEKVSENKPREWTGDYGTTYYIKVMLKGHQKPVEIGKKSPDALKVGDTVFGEIQAKDFDTDGFKHERKPMGGGSFQSRPDHHEEIKAQWAIGQAINFLTTIPGEQKNPKDPQLDIETWAKNFYAMVERVKTGLPTPKAADVESDVTDADLEEPINLDGIPF